MSAPHLPEVLPPPDLSPQAMTSTIRLAVHSQPLDRSQALYQYFVRLGLDVAAEPMHWDLAALRSE